MSGAIPPLLQYAFMAWCSVKAEVQLYFTFNFGWLVGWFGRSVGWLVDFEV
jgi:hypothetical protein